MVSIGLVYLHIVKKWRIGQMLPILTDRQGKIVLLKLLRSRSGALVTQLLSAKSLLFFLVPVPGNRDVTERSW